MKRFLRVLIPVFVILSVLAFGIPAQAATTADITVTARAEFVGISCNQNTYDFGTVATSATPSTSTSWATITNTSTVQTDQTISVTTSVWDGAGAGVNWTHDDTATPGVLTAGLKANKGGTWGVSDIVVKNGTPNDIATNQAALTDYSFGLKLWAPTSFAGDDGSQKTITVRISAAAG